MVIMSALIIVCAWKTDKKGKHLLVSHCMFELNGVFYCLLYILL